MRTSTGQYATKAPHADGTINLAAANKDDGPR